MADASTVADNLITNLRKTYPANLFEITGDIRRQNETIGIIEIVTDLERK